MRFILATIGVVIAVSIVLDGWAYAMSGFPPISDGLIKATAIKLVMSCIFFYTFSTHKSYES